MGQFDRTVFLALWLLALQGVVGLLFLQRLNPPTRPSKYPDFPDGFWDPRRYRLKSPALAGSFHQDDAYGLRYVLMRVSFPQDGL